MSRLLVWFASVVALAWLVRANLLEVHRVTGGSMAPTLKPGDRLLVNELAYGWKPPFLGRRFGARLPQRGDVIVFPREGRDDGGQQAEVLVKRVIGLPGDVVAFSAGSPVINGWVVPSCDAGPFLTAARGAIVRGRLAVEVLDGRAYLTIRTPLDDARFGPFRVAPGEVFVMGDARGVSADSRTWNDGRGGGVPIDGIEGRVSRLVAGAFRDGRLDVHHLLTSLRPEVREPNVDLRETEQRIAACCARLPRSTRPPPSRSGHPNRSVNPEKENKTCQSSTRH